MHRSVSGETFIRYSQRLKVRRPNNLKPVGRKKINGTKQDRQNLVKVIYVRGTSTLVLIIITLFMNLVIFRHTDFPMRVSVTKKSDLLSVN